MCATPVDLRVMGIDVCIVIIQSVDGREDMASTITVVEAGPLASTNSLLLAHCSYHIAAITAYLYSIVVFLDLYVIKQLSVCFYLCL